MMKRKLSKSNSKLPSGWTAKAVRELAAYYDSQGEDEAAAEDEAAWHDPKQATMAVPVELVQKVQQLIRKAAG